MLHAGRRYETCLLQNVLFYGNSFFLKRTFKGGGVDTEMPGVDIIGLKKVPEPDGRALKRFTIPGIIIIQDQSPGLLHHHLRIV